MTVRDDARAVHERFFANVLEMDLDFCQNSYGISPCEAGLVVTGTAQAGSTTSITLAAGDTAVSNEYIDFLIYIESGVGATQAGFISDYNATTKVADVVFSVAPNDTSVYRIHRLRGQVVHAGVCPSGSGFDGLSLALTAAASNDFYNGMKVRMLSGQYAGEIRDITDYGTAEDVLALLTVSPRWSLAGGPNAGDQYIIVDEQLPANCYNTFITCQDKVNYDRGTKTYKTITCGATLPPGEELRPYICGLSPAAAQIKPDTGLALRSRVTVQLVDEVSSDVGLDPYFTSRLNAPGSTYWARLLARNPYYAGRFARLRRGYVVDPWDWDTFQNELYIIDSITGPKKNGAVTITLVDPLKLADKNKIPAATDGKLTHALKAKEHVGTARAATATTIDLAFDAVAVDDFYNGMHIFITGGKGPKQERTITAYAAATRRATLATWDITPDDTSTYEIQRVAITLDSGKGAQYPDPAVTGQEEFFRSGKEIIKYDDLTGDVLSWPAISYRGQFGSTIEDHKINDNVQQCRAYISESFSAVVQDLLNSAGVADANIDLVLLQDQDAIWLGEKYAITGILSTPEKPNDVLKELCIQANGFLVWSTVNQKVEFRVIAPQPPMAGGFPLLNDEAGLIDDSVDVKLLDDLRITSAAINYNMIDATDNKTEARNYADGLNRIDTDAESANEHDDERPFIIFSRWLTTDNLAAVTAWSQRKLLDRRDAPIKITAKIDPKDYTFKIGELLDIETNRLVDFAGEPKLTRCLITKVVDRGKNIDIELLSSRFSGRYAFIAPNGYPDYGLATTAQRQYAFTANTSQEMGNGDDPYLII